MTRGPDQTPQPYRPPDFEEFWQRLAASRSSRPVAAVREHIPADDIPGFRIERIDFKGDSGNLLHGWISIPQPLPKPLPAFLWLPGYGRESHVPDEYSCYPGFVSMAYNLHGHGAMHQEEYTPERGYFARGVEDPEKWVFRGLILDAMRALDILAAQPEVGPGLLGCTGISQGAGMALMLGMISERLGAVCADVPFLAAMPLQIRKASYRYPLKELKDWADARPLGMEQVMGTLSYYDTLNCAGMVRTPVQVSYGTKDPATPAFSVIALGEELPEPKRVIGYQDLGHDWSPEMPANNSHWFRKYLVDR
jgi:cephalosporin-C deacetylase